MQYHYIWILASKFAVPARNPLKMRSQAHLMTAEYLLLASPLFLTCLTVVIK